VDLNSILYKVEFLLDYYHKLLNIPPPRDYRAAMDKRKSAMHHYLWNKDTNQWHDYDMSKGSHNLESFPSNFLPLWSGAYNESDSVFKESILTTLQNSGLIQPGGVLTSGRYTGQQWDLPNAWSPLQSLLIDSLLRMNTSRSTTQAQTLALQWIKANYLGFAANGFMFEKYNAFKPGEAGDGGEYEPQIGFGWTNGVVLELLRIYGQVARFK